MERKSSQQEAQAPSGVLSHPAFLNGWKEIAHYLGRGVRTVQRWEALGLPVRRPNARLRSAVVSSTVELDAWLQQCSDGRCPRPDGANGTFPPFAEELMKLREELEKLRSENQRLRRQLEAIRNPHLQISGARLSSDAA